MIDNSSAWRMDPDVPLVVAEVNPQALRTDPQGHRRQPQLHDDGRDAGAQAAARRGRAQRLVVSTYQAVSGGGVAGIEELDEPAAATPATSAAALAHDGDAVAFPAPASGRCRSPSTWCRSTIGIVEDGYTEEEIKLRDESRKILGIPDLPVSGTCVRVPVFTGHSLSINAEFERDLLGAERRSNCCARRRAWCCADVPNPLEATGRDPVFVGRVRRDPTVDARPRAVRQRRQPAQGRGAQRGADRRSAAGARPGPQAARDRLVSRFWSWSD